MAVLMNSWGGVMYWFVCNRCDHRSGPFNDKEKARKHKCRKCGWQTKRP